MQERTQKMLPRIVLVRPRNPTNIGSVARAMNNFGFKELVVVAPHPPVWDEVKTSAIGSETVIANAKVVPRVLDAVSDCSLVIGTTDARRAGGETPKEFVEAGIWKSERSAILFGSEKSGLSNQELSYCSSVVSIPTSPECPSMNLSHAVAVIGYEFCRSATAADAANAASRVPAGDIELVIEAMRSTLKDADFFTPTNEERMLMEIRASLLRYQLTRREAGILLGALRRISHAIGGGRMDGTENASET